MHQPDDAVPQGRPRRRRRHALLACTILALDPGLSLVSAGPAMAQGGDQTGAQSAARYISIGAGPLTRSLNELASQTGLQIIYDASLAAAQTGPAIDGTYTADEVLGLLLAGTGITARIAQPGQVALSFSEIPEEDDAFLGTIRLYGSRDATTLEGSNASVGVVTSEDIHNEQLRYLPQAMRRLANVEKGATNNTGIVIRGMNFEGFSPAGAPMGSVYVDGVLQSRYNSRFGARGLWDAEQVEVYRGPQSTLSGRAATAGAIYLKTKDPTFEQEAELSATFGTKDLAGGAFVLNQPLSEENGLALRLSGSYERLTTEIDYPNYTQFNNYDDFRTEISGLFRAKLLYEPTFSPGTRALLTYSYTKDRPNERLVGPDVDDRGDFYQFSTFAEYREIDVNNVGLEVTHDISPSLRFTSLTGGSFGLTQRESVDNGTPNIDNAFYGDYQDNIFTQEFRLNYDAGRWSWVAGVYGSYEDQDSEFFARLMEWGVEQSQIYKRRTTNMALFGEATYEFAPGWNVTLGGRVDYIEETTDETDTVSYIGSGASSTRNTARISETNFVPKFALFKEIDDNHRAGFTFSGGFRTGGFYVDPVTGNPEYYDPEFANNYELFYKGLFLDNRLRLNANLFYTEYRNQQVETYAGPGVGTGTIVTNAASSYATGFELESNYDVTDNFTAFAALGYLHTEFKAFDHTIYGDLAGEPFPEAPAWTIALGGTYEFDNGFYLGGDVKFLSDYTARFSTNAPLDQIDQRFLVNLQAGVRRGNWEINAFVENLLDESYYTVTELDGVPEFAQIGPSLLFGVNLRAYF